MSVFFKSPLAATALSPALFYFVPQEKGLIKSQSFTCALIGLHHGWVWQPCEVMTFCKYLDDTRKSDSFTQVNELKKFWQVQMTPWHGPPKIWVHFAPRWWSIFRVQNRFSHILPWICALFSPGFMISEMNLWKFWHYFWKFRHYFLLTWKFRHYFSSTLMLKLMETLFFKLLCRTPETI